MTSPQPDDRPLADRIERVLAIGAFAWLVLFSLYFVFRLPIPSYMDEVQSVDYGLKLVRHGWATPHQPLEPAMQDFFVQRHQAMTSFYFGDGADRTSKSNALDSHLAYHPPLFYLPAGCLYTIITKSGATTETGFVALRLLCTAMMIAARLVLYLTIRRWGSLVALCSLPYLCLMVPIDLTRISNDSLATLIGASVFWLLAHPGIYISSRKILLTAGALLVLGIGVKLNVLLFLIPCLLVVIAARWREGRWSVRRLALLLTPGAIACIMFAAYHYAISGDITGTRQLDVKEFAPPIGAGVLEFLPSVGFWVFWFVEFFTLETRIGGLNGLGLYRYDQIVSMHQIGFLVAVGISLFGNGLEAARRVGWKGAEPRDWRRFVLACTLAVIVLMFTRLVMGTFIGVFALWFPRQYYLIEFVFVFPSALGWAYIARAIPHRHRFLGWLLAIGIAALFASATLAYVSAGLAP